MKWTYFNKFWISHFFNLQSRITINHDDFKMCKNNWSWHTLCAEYSVNYTVVNKDKKTHLSFWFMRPNENVLLMNENIHVYMDLNAKMHLLKHIPNVLREWLFDELYPFGLHYIAKHICSRSRPLMPKSNKDQYFSVVFFTINFYTSSKPHKIFFWKKFLSDNGISVHCIRYFWLKEFLWAGNIWKISNFIEQFFVTGTQRYFNIGS